MAVGQPVGRTGAHWREAETAWQVRENQEHVLACAHKPLGELVHYEDYTCQPFRKLSLLMFLLKCNSMYVLSY